MLNHLAGRINLFLLVRTHTQLQHHLHLSDSRSAANQGGISTSAPEELGNVAEIHPLHVSSLRRRG